MGELFPSAEVIGVDLSPIQPNWVVPNVRFEVDDLELDWTFRKVHTLLQLCTTENPLTLTGLL